MDKLTRQEWKTKRYLDKQFSKYFKDVKKKIKRIKVTKVLKEALIDDLAKCNNIEIMTYLVKAPFSTIDEYKEQVNAWLQLEAICYDYPEKMIYNGTNFEALTDVIIKRHRYLDLKKSIFRI